MVGHKASSARSSTSQSSSTEEQKSDFVILPKRKGRGRTKGLTVQKKRQESADGKLDVIIHPTKKVAVGPGRKDFITDLSVIVHQSVRHNVYKWKQVPQNVKDTVVQSALKNWRLPDTDLVRRAILEEANRLYRNWRNRLHEHFLMFETKEEALEHVPEDICDSDWQFLVDYFSSPAFERDPVTGKEPDMQKLWELTHKRANGEWVDEASKEINDKVAEQIEEELHRLENSGDGIENIEPEIVDAAFRSVIGKKSGLLLDGAPGMGPESFIRREADAQRREAEEARRECNELRAKLAEVEFQLVEERRKREEIEVRLLDRQKEMREINSQVQASIQAALSQYQVPTSQAEISSSNQKRKIAELEAQLHEAEDVITDLRTELSRYGIR